MFRKMIYLSLVIFCASTAFAKEKKPLPEVTQVLPLFEVDSSILTEFVQGKHPETAIECPAGIDIPLRLFQTNKYFQLKFAPNLSLRLQKTIYFRVARRRWYASTDLENWKNPERFLEEALDGSANVKVKNNPNDQSILVEVDWDSDLAE